jgi:hypothetical protein
MPDGRDDRSSIVGLEPTFECLRENLGQWPEVADWVKSPTAAHAQSGSQKLDSAD